MNSAPCCCAISGRCGGTGILTTLTVAPGGSMMGSLVVKLPATNGAYVPGIGPGCAVGSGLGPRDEDASDRRLPRAASFRL